MSKYGLLLIYDTMKFVLLIFFNLHTLLDTLGGQIYFPVKSLK
jgi:hypothetical protein